MTAEQFESKTKSLAKMRIKYKFHVIHDDNAAKINIIKEVIDKLEKELKDGIHQKEININYAKAYKKKKTDFK